MFDQIEGHVCSAEKASNDSPSPRVRKSRAGKSSGVGQACRAEKATNYPPASLDTNQPEEGHFCFAEQAVSATSTPVDTIVNQLVALQKQRRFIIKSQSRIDRSLEQYLATLAGYRPKVADDGTKLRDDAGKAVQDKDGKKLWAEISRIRKLVESGKELPARAGQARGAEKANTVSPARKESREGGREGQQYGDEKSNRVLPSLPSWADVPMILASAQTRIVWDKMRDQVEKEMASLAKQLPVYPWWKNIRGAGDIGLAKIVGEAGNLSKYRDKSALWKRLGLAVIDGGRQRRVAGEAALLHGYSPARRSEIWNIADSLFRAQWRGADEDANLPARPIGPYGEYYGRRRTYLAATRPDVTAGHANNEARRYMTKALIRDLRGAWNATA